MPNNDSSGNFIIQCTRISYFDESCILGSTVLISSFCLLRLIILAFIKMTNFYKKMNFENTIILLSIIQTIILQLVLLLSYDLLFETFFLIQIFIISLIIRKFNISAHESNDCLTKNCIFIILNFFNLIIFLIYPLYLSLFKGHHSFIKLFYRIFHAVTTCILSYYCCYFVKLTAERKDNYYSSDYFFYKESISNNETNDKNIKKDTSNNENNKDKNKNTNKNNNDNIKNNNQPIISKSKEEEVFYLKKKKQMTYLYSVNLLCAFVEICFTITRNFILNEHYIENDYKTLPKTTTGDILYYIYLIICFFNVSVNYLCFYYFIRHQYSYRPNIEKKPEKKVIDNNFLKIQENLENSGNDELNNFLYHSSSKRNEKEETVAISIKPDNEGNLRFSDLESGNNALLP